MYSLFEIHTHTHKHRIEFTEIMNFATECNAVNTQISKSFREYSIDILFNDCKSKQKCPIRYNVGLNNESVCMCVYELANSFVA